MRHPGDREGHGPSQWTWSGCILSLCRGESQAKICKHRHSRWLGINRLRVAWTFASRSGRSHDLHPYSEGAYAEKSTAAAMFERGKRGSSVCVGPQGAAATARMKLPNPTMIVEPMRMPRPVATSAWVRRLVPCHSWSAMPQSVLKMMMLAIWSVQLEKP